MSDIGEGSRTWQLEQTIASLQARIELLEHDAKTRDYETLYAQAVCELQAAQAREADLRKTVQFVLTLTDEQLEARFPHDDSALKTRLKAERERCAKVCDARRQTVSNGAGMSMWSHDPASVEASYCADVIRNLGDQA